MTPASGRAAGQVRRRLARIPGDSSPWIAWCRACSWQHSYPTWPVAFHAAAQHVTHWRAVEDARPTPEEAPF